MKSVIVSALCVMICLNAFGQNSRFQNNCDLKSGGEPQEVNQELAKAVGTQMTPVTIPVVFHVIWNTPVQNIPDTQICSQLEVLNECFGRTNPDTLGIPPAFLAVRGKSNFRFELAAMDPAGNATTGITRTYSQHAPFGQGYYEQIKHNSTGGHDAWDIQHYLNIWVFYGDTIAGVGSLVDNTMFPWFVSAGYTPGILVNYLVVGRNRVSYPPLFNQGKGMMHAMSHFFGLSHDVTNSTFVCADDGIIDTPPVTGMFGGTPLSGLCPAFPYRDTCSGPDGVMFNHFVMMVSDSCKNMFTKGQVARMNAVAQQYLPSLLMGFIPTHPPQPCAVISALPEESPQELDFKKTDGETYYAVNTTSKSAELSVINSLGQVVFAQRIETGTTSIKLPILSSAFYAYRIEGVQLKKGKLIIY